MTDTYRDQPIEKRVSALDTRIGAQEEIWKELDRRLEKVEKKRKPWILSRILRACFDINHDVQPFGIMLAVIVLLATPVLLIYCGAQEYHHWDAARSCQAFGGSMISYKHDKVLCYRRHAFYQIQGTNITRVGGTEK